MDADTLRHIDDGSARIEDEANGLILVLLGEVAACRHAIPSAAISGSLRPGVYKIGNGPLDSEKGIYNPTGLMPADGPATCLAVLQANNDVTGKKLDLAATFTNDFAQATQNQ